MTRQQCLQQVLRNGSPFYGELPYVPYYWDIHLSGLTSEDDWSGEVLVLDVTDEDRRIFPELAHKHRVRLIRNTIGVVYEI